MMLQAIDSNVKDFPSSE